MKLRENFRDLQQWNAIGLPIKSTSSDSAVKLFDSALTQYVGWYDDDIGLAGTIEKMIQVSPDFILGRTLAIGLDLIGTGTSIRQNSKLSTDLEELKQMVDKRKPEIEWRELAHVKALDLLANGNMTAAGQVYERILEKHPNDMMALKIAHDIYFYLGDKTNLLDSIEKVYPQWENNQDPLQAYIHGMYAFGLEERRQYAKAEEQAKLGLSKLPQDAWAVHALAHVHEMQHRTEEGLKAISDTNKDWHDCNYLACHNYWHWALFHIEQNQPEQSVSIYSNQIGPQANKIGNMLDIIDATSLLYRLDLLYPEKFTAKHWPDLYTTCEPHFKDHILGFNDVHFTMACLGNARIDKAEELLEHLRSTKMAGVLKDHWVDVTEQVLESMIDFKRERYQSTVDKLMANKDNILKMGGSDAQRDVFNQLLLVAAMKAKATDLCQTLIKERQTIRGDDIVIRKIFKTLKNC